MAMTYTTATQLARVRPTAHRQAGGKVHLTQRGRLTIFLTVVVVSLLAVFGHAAASADAPHAPTPVSVHVVVSGETLWSVARSITPAGDDVRDTIIEIERLSSLSSSDLAIGQELLLPKQ